MATATSLPPSQPSTSGQRLAAAGAVLLLLANVVVPLAVGDLYPFTSAPMFRDAPEVYCNYRVYGPEGNELPPCDFLLQRLYDGNPLGYGVGIAPPPILERFGTPRTEAEIVSHIRPFLQRPPYQTLPYVEVVQETVGAVDAQRVGVIKTERLRILREAQP